jgi:hypothetical protein
MYNYQIGCDCCSVFGSGQRLIERKSVTLNYSVSDEYGALYPFVNDGCGCGEDSNCAETYPYRYNSVTTTGSPAPVWDGGEGTVPFGGTSTSTADAPTEQESEPSYFTCTCAEVSEDPIICTQNCGSGEKHASEKVVNLSFESNVIEGTGCAPSVGCVVPFSSCQGVLCPDDAICGKVTSGSCTFKVAYSPTDGYEGDVQTVTLNYSGQVDMWDLPWDRGMTKLSDIDYPASWNDTQDCRNDGVNSWWFDPWIILNPNPNDVVVSSVASKVNNGTLNNINCGIAPSVGSQFQKVKFRWRFLVPSSCYIKIWICRYEATWLTSFATPETYDEWNLTSSSVESHVIDFQSLNGKCFDGFNSCGNHQLSSALSPEFELVSPSAEFPSIDPEIDPNTNFNSSITLTKYKGISLVGLSYVDGWNPPLFEYNEDVWKSIVTNMPIPPCSPYFTPTYIPSFPYDQQAVNTNTGIYWPNTPEQTQKAIDYFNENINVVVAP